VSRLQASPTPAGDPFYSPSNAVSAFDDTDAQQFDDADGEGRGYEPTYGGDDGDAGDGVVPVDEDPPHRPASRSGASRARSQSPARTPRSLFRSQRGRVSNPVNMDMYRGISNMK
jgi:hypothetical protein